MEITMKITLKKLLLTGAAVAVFALSSSAFAATKADYEKAVTAAQAAIKQAAAMDDEWRDSGKLLKKAAEAAKAGDFDKAVKLAKAAEFQGKMAQEQAKANANAGNPDYLYK
jgi:hypothetical protein